MKRTIPVLLSLLSGAIWAVIAYVVAYSMIGRAGMSSQVGRRLIVGMIAAPIIGAVIGGGSRGFARLGRTGRIALALVDLYFAAFLFLWAAGLEIVPAIMWGITLNAYFLVLWPLSYMNHSLVARSWSSEDGSGNG